MGCGAVWGGRSALGATPRTLMIALGAVTVSLWARLARER
jgi:hypothetical protein